MWKDWPESEATWELESNLTNCVELLEQYNAMISKKKETGNNETQLAEKKEERYYEKSEKPNTEIIQIAPGNSGIL